MSIGEMQRIFREAGFEVDWTVLGIYSAVTGTPYRLKVACEGITFADADSVSFNPVYIPERLVWIAEYIVRYREEYPVGVVSAAIEALSKVRAGEAGPDDRFSLK